MDRNLLGRATEGTDAPTPGYLYVDLVKAATANPTACQEMAQYLTRKLANKQNPNVKYKCLKVIAKLSEQVPRNQFRRCIAQDAQAVASIKEAIQFRGPLDVVQGDTKNEKVRTAAREALDAVYTETPSSEGRAAMTSSAMSASYASAPHAGGYGGGGGYTGGNRMEGIGNPNYSDPRNDPRYNGQSSAFQEAMKEAGEVVIGMIKDPLARNVGPVQDVPSRGHSGNLPGYGSHRSSGPPPGAAELSSRTGGQWTMASNRGPDAVTGGGPATSEYYKERDTGFNSWNNSNSTSATAGVPGGSWGTAGASSVASQAREPAYGTPSVTIVNNPAAPAVNGTVGASLDGTYEKNLILELCPPGGVKPVPPVDKLANFARSVSSLNSELICPVLLDFLEEGQPWVIRAKALCVMETAIQNGVVASTGTNPYKTFFHACAGEIQPLASHPRAAIKDPAKRVLLLLGITPEPGADAPAAPTSAQGAEAPNLLDFGDEVAAAPPATQPPQPPLPPPTETPPPPPDAALPATAPPVTAAAGGSGNMFGGMSVKGAAQAPAAEERAAPAPLAADPAPAAPESDNLLDFSATDVFAPTPAAVAAPPPKTDNTATAATGMFGDLSIKEEKKKEDVEPATTEAAAQPTAGSAFGFINNDAAAAPAAASKPKTFDPLQNAGGTSTAATASAQTMSPTGGKQTLSLSTEQMQAMAYQQMMMQQAQQMQQMQQMQMAMMAQQTSQRGSVTAAGMVPAPGPPLQFRQSSGSGTVPSPYQQARPIKKDDKKFDFVKDHMLQTKK